MLTPNYPIHTGGGSPAQVVMGGESRPRGRDFESKHWILDGSFFTFICCKLEFDF